MLLQNIWKKLKANIFEIELIKPLNVKKGSLKTAFTPIHSPNHQIKKSDQLKNTD
jgi:hypothetical protein